MNRQPIERFLLGLLAVSALVVGLWAQFFPRSFYDSFPGGGRSWVSPDGPYNEHLVRDVGGLNLALAVVTIAALLRVTPFLVRIAAIAWLVYGVPHLVYHAAHLAPFDTSDRIAELASLAVVVVAPLVLLVLAQLDSNRDRAGGGP
jgi:hypothetical protein